MNKYVFGGVLVLGLFAFRRKSSFNYYSALGRLDAVQLDSIAEIEKAFARYGDGDERKLVYIIATAWHESRLRPIREIRATQGSEVWNIQNRYWSTGYFGRGYAQLTWHNNYKKMSDILNVDLISDPDKALIPALAAKIIVIGMMRGTFTSKRLSEYIGIGTDFYNARRVLGAIWVAGTDTGAIIQKIAQNILSSK